MMTISKLKLFGSTCAATALVMAAFPAVAQVAGAADKDEPTSVGDIIVTANKRSERLQDVPVSVVALPAELLESQNVREVQDLTKLVPSMTVSYGSQPANFSINMRGVGTFSNGIAVESDVAVVLDDVPFSFQAASFTDLVDVGQVEVLRGPQSTLFGKSAIAGVLNVTSRAPTEYLSTIATALVTDDGEWRVGASVSGPISENLLFRLTASASDFEGNVENTHGGKINGSGGQTLRGKLLWRPASNVEISLAPHYSTSDINCCVSPIRRLAPVTGTGLFYQGITALPLGLVAPGVTPSEFNNRVANDERAGGDSRLAGATVKASIKFDDTSPLAGATLQYIGSYNDWKMDDFQDVDATSYPVLLNFPAASPLGLNSGSRIDGNFTARSFTNELRLTSPGGQRVNYVLGLWQSSNDLTRYLHRGPGVAAVKYETQSSNSQIAAFGDINVRATDNLVLLGGLRVQNQRISYALTKYFGPEAYLTKQSWNQADSENAVTGKLGAQYFFAPDVMAYATYSTGYKGEAYDLVSFFSDTTAANMPVLSETADSYEIGLKSQLFDRALTLNLAAFQTDYKGFQVSSTTIQPDGSFTSVLNSVGSLRTRGVELEAYTRPVHGISFGLSAGYVDAEITDFPLGPCYPGQTAAQGCRPFTSSSGSVTNVQNLAGSRLSNAPKFKYNLSANYLGGSAGDSVRPFAGVNYRHQSSVNFSLNQDPVTVQPSYGILDLRAGVELKGGAVRLTAFANNVLDEHYAVGLLNGNFGYFSSTGAAASGAAWQPARDSWRYFGFRVDLSY